MFRDFVGIACNYFQITVYIGIEPKPLSCWQDHDSNKNRRLSPMRQSDGLRVAWQFLPKMLDGFGDE